MRYRPNLDFRGGSTMVETLDHTDKDTGVVTSQDFYPQSEELPEPELFDIQSMVKAGIPIQKTSTKILGTSLGAVSDIFNNDDNFNDKDDNNE